MLKWPDKDPDEVLDYRIDWSDRLSDGDTIQSSSWIIEGSVDKDSDSNSTTTATIWLSGGDTGSVSFLTNRVITLGGRTMDTTVRLKIKEK